MPVYEQGYRRYEARAPLRRARFWPITREALRALAARKLMLVMLAVFGVIAWIPTLAGLVYLYVVTRLPNAPSELPADARVFGQMLRFQEFFVFLITLFVGAGLVAGDLRTGGIVAYLSRPLTRRDYVLGKLLALLLPQLAVTLLPGLLFYAGALAVVPDRFARWELAWLGPAIAAQSLLMALSFSAVMLALSSLVRSARVAGLLFFGVLVSSALAGILGAIFNRPEAGLLSLPALLRATGDALFGLSGRRPELHWGPALVVLALLALGSLLILRARVRAVEIVQ